MNNTERIQNEIIGRLTVENKVLTDKVYEYVTQIEKYRKEMGFDYYTSFEDIWINIKDMRRYLWQSFVDKAYATSDSIDDEQLENNFERMFKSGDWKNVQEYINDSTLPF